MKRQETSEKRSAPTSMGDFAAGKLLGDGVPERGEILPEDIKQCVVDIDNKIAKLGDGPPMSPGASAESLAAISGSVPPLLESLLALHDGGYHVFDFKLYSTEELQGDVGTTIGVNPLDNTALTFDPSSGALFSIDSDGTQTEVSPSFGAYLESFRDALLSGKVEWADGWVSTS